MDISSSPTSRCRRRSRATRPASSAVRMACCCSRRFRAGAGSVSRIWKRTWRAVSAEEVVARVVARLGEKYRPTDVAWFAPFRMHRRIVSRLADGHRFLIGDAAHLSSPFGGEGLNAGLHDGYDLAWKLALVAARPRESGAARRLHGGAPDRGPPRAGRLRPGAPFDRRRGGRRSAAPRDSRRGRRPDRGRAGAQLARDDRRRLLGKPARRRPRRRRGRRRGPRPGQWYPDWSRFGGTSHHVLVFGAVADAESLARLGRRWSKLVEISHNPKRRSRSRRLPAGGVIMIRPDGHIGFRFPTTEAEAFTALDRHLASYLIGPGRRSSRRGDGACEWLISLRRKPTPGDFSRCSTA